MSARSLLLHAALGLGVTLLAGCSHYFQGIPDLMDAADWEGRPLQEAVDTFGEPSDVVKDAQNNSVARWIYSEQFTRTQGYNELSAGPTPGGVMVTPHSYEETYGKECRLELTFNAQNVITDFKTWKSVGDACNSYSFAYPKQ
ncbi:hypothetical protein HNP46_004601 [Pseudomonas nitritireducens]|uniref:Lipoprotein n=1 Tax=Pseudomonas nitroreducens TaxID=46680 RepID=A0A7W7P3L0_PSENT|nr:hypothetical protein [Pseudomonas nitritireducens]MBB4865700.1 hypothetical protein [Pseudomonas nitritireducens]